jgi:predicted ATP-grasp superfamily ATP-dependent carboligase
MHAIENARLQFDRGTPALILKTVAQPMHHGTLGAIRSLGRAGAPVYGCRERGPAPAALSRYLARETLGILGPFDPEATIAELKAFQRQVGKPMVVVPVDDAGAIFIAEHADQLRPHFLLPAQKPHLPRAVASKAMHAQLCADAGIPAPATAVVRSQEDLTRAGALIGYPVVAKIAQPWLLPTGLQAVVLARSPTDLGDYYARASASHGADIIVQQYIPDEWAEDWFYHGYHGSDGGRIVGFTGRKLRSHPPFFGATSYGVSIVNEEVMELAGSMLRMLGYAGIVELEFRFDRRVGEYKLVDFNPRLGAQFQFLRNDAGIDVVRAMHLDLTGREAPAGGQVEGRAFLSEFTDLAVFAAYRRRGMVSAASWLRQAFGATDHAWFALDDLRPFSAAGGVWARRLLASAARRARQVVLRRPPRHQGPHPRAPCGRKRPLSRAG